MAFLSDEWIAALDQAAASSGVGAGLSPDEEVSIEQVVVAQPSAGAGPIVGDAAYDAAGEPVVYHLVLAGDGASVKPGRHSQPMVRFTTDRATAGAIYAGEQSALGAFRLGLLEVQGDLAALERHRAELDLLDKSFQSVRAVTEI